MEIDFAQDPITLFHAWLADSLRTEMNDAEAMSLATVSADGRPSVRMVLLKGVDAQGFCFYTNMESRKGRELATNPYAALCFHWKSLLRQVRVEGKVERVTDEMSDAYFNSRHPVSRLGAWASRQSQPLESRAVLETRMKEYAEKFGDTIPRPPYWGGYRVVPDRIEFWQQGDNRLHDRFLFTHMGAGWNVSRLNP